MHVNISVDGVYVDTIPNPNHSVGVMLDNSIYDYYIKKDDLDKLVAISPVQFPPLENNNRSRIIVARDAEVIRLDKQNSSVFLYTNDPLDLNILKYHDLNIGHLGVSWTIGFISEAVSGEDTPPNRNDEWLNLNSLGFQNPQWKVKNVLKKYPVLEKIWDEAEIFQRFGNDTNYVSVIIRNDYKTLRDSKISQWFSFSKTNTYLYMKDGVPILHTFEALMDDPDFTDNVPWVMAIDGTNGNIILTINSVPYGGEIETLKILLPDAIVVKLESDLVIKYLTSIASATDYDATRKGLFNDHFPQYEDKMVLLVSEKDKCMGCGYLTAASLERVISNSADQLLTAEEINKLDSRTRALVESYNELSYW